MSDKTCVVVKTTPGVTAEQARDLRARCWLYIFQAHYARKAAGRSGQDARKEDEHVSGKIILP